MKTVIITDSTADMMQSERERVRTVALTVRFGDTEFIDRITIDHKTFYEKLVECDTLPSTSQATPDSFAKEFERVKQEGAEAIVITLSSKLSGTYQSALIAAQDYDNIYVVDSGTATIGAGILTERALALLDEERSAKEIAQTLEREKEKIIIVDLVDTLEYLKRGGRISKTVAVAFFKN